VTALVIAPHPDDETLACGGTIAALAAANVEVYVIAVVCHQSNTGDVDVMQPADRAAEFTEACKILGAAGCEIAMQASVHQTLYDREAELVSMFEKDCEYSIDQVSPDIVLFPAGDSYHQDHRVVHGASFAACRPRGIGGHMPRNVLGYHGPEDVWRSQPGTTPAFFDITHVRDRKLKALHAYDLQLRRPPHPRSIEAINARDTTNGSRFGVGAAEIFTPYRLDLKRLSV
jgi:LmbE family N-acetylglucosaminyl deacetylase